MITASSRAADPALVRAVALLDAFRCDVRAKLAVGTLGQSVIGKDMELDGPLGPRRMLYADYAASGRALREVEDFVLEHVLPVYANPHTQASFCGRSINALRRAARAEVARFCGADEEDAVIFAGSGATAGIQKLVRLFGADRIDDGGRAAMVLLGPYEHHSNLLPWRESGAEVIELPEDAAGGPDRRALATALATARGRRIIAAFSAGSNITGALTDIAAVSRMVQAAGGKVIWDHAGAAPYRPMTMQPAHGVHIDALVFSPHKLLGGPASSGVLVVRRDAVVLDRPTAAGGGTVSFVSPQGHDYLPDLTPREEAGTPDAIGDIRTALAVIVSACMTEAGLDLRAEALCRAAMTRWSAHPLIEILGCPDAPRLPIISFRLRRRSGGIVHHQLVTRILSDCFGIQARGGCACAGPYVHRLLGLDENASQAIHQAVRAGRELEKPGFVRVNFSALMSDTEWEYLVASVIQLAENADGLSQYFVGDAANAVFEPVAAPAMLGAR